MRHPSSSSPLLPPTGRGLAVLVGIDAYGHGIAPLRNAVRDVRSVAQILAHEHGYTTQLLLDSDATLAGIRAMLAGLALQVTAETRLVLYFAGHGIAEETEQATDGPRGLLIPQDARRDDPQTFLPMAEIQAALAKLPCKHLLLFLDCCFAGAFRWSSTRSIGVRRKTLYRERYERYLRDSARQVITSASADEYALDTVAGGKLGRRVEEAENSPFATALCQGLRGNADLRLDGQPGDGVILSSELHLYLEGQFHRLEQKLGRALQKPLLWALDGHDKGQFFFFTPGRPLALPSALALNEDNNPYRGLLPYEARHAKEFFGREGVVDALQAQVLGSPLVLVSGVSGSGKSSVVRAGLMPRLAALSEWKVLDVVRPGQHPLSELAAILGSLGASRDAALSAASGAWQAQNPGRRLLLVIDQLEELVTLGASDAERTEFLQRIRDAVTASAGLLHVVFTLRSDFEPHFSDLLATRDHGVTRFLVTPPDRQALRQIIEGPASERVLFFEPATLVDRLIDEVAEMPGALPLLSFTLSELYRAYLRSGRDDRSLRMEDYEKLGGVAGSLSQRADEIFNALDSAHQQTLRRLMLRMVALQTGEVARRRVPNSELDYGKTHPEQPRITALRKQLEGARLLVSGQDSDGTAYVEPAHDKLILGWPRLWTFLKDDQETIPLQRMLTQEALAWLQTGHQSDHLWSGNPRLPLVVQLQENAPERFNALETAFIDRSERRRKRQRNLWIAVPCLVIAVLSGLVWFAFDARKKAVEQTKRTEEQKARAELQTKLAQEQKSRAEQQTKLAQEQKSRAELQTKRTEEQKARADEQTERAMQQIYASYVEEGRKLLFEKRSPGEALRWLHRALVSRSTHGALPDLLKTARQDIGVGHTHIEDTEHVSFSPSGQHLVIASADGVARVLDANTGGLLLELQDSENVEHVQYSPDGRYIVTGSNGGAARIWHAETGRMFVDLIGHTKDIRVVEYSPDGRHIVSTSADGTTRVWSADTGRPVTVLRGNQENVLAVRFRPDGRQFLTFGPEKTAGIFDAETGRQLLTLQARATYFEDAHYSPNGRYVVTAESEGRTARIFDSTTGRLFLEFGNQGAEISRVAYRPDGLRIVTAGNEDKTARVFDAQTGDLVLELSGHDHGVLDACFSPDGHSIVTSSDDRTARVWDANTGHTIAVLRGHHDSVVTAHYSSNGRRIATVGGGEDLSVRVWDANRGQSVGTLSGHEKDITEVAYSPDGRLLVTVSDDQTGKVWELNSGKLVATLKGHRAGIVHATFSPDSRRIITVSKDQTARVWHPNTGVIVTVYRRQSGQLDNALYSPNGRRILLTGPTLPAEVWEADPGHLLFELRGKPDLIRDATYTTDGQRIMITTQQGGIMTFDAGTGKLLTDSEAKVPLRVRYSTTREGVSYSPDGHRLVVTAEYFPARVLDVQQSRLIATLKDEYGLQRVIFSPDSQRFITRPPGNVARVWNANTGQLIAALHGHTAAIQDAVFRSDGRRVVTVSGDHTARVFESDTGGLVAELLGHTGRLTKATYSPDGRRLVTVGDDHTAHIWDVSQEAYSPQQLALYLDCYVPFRFEPKDSNVLIPVRPDPKKCQAPAQIPSR